MWKLIVYYMPNRCSYTNLIAVGGNPGTEGLIDYEFHDQFLALANIQVHCALEISSSNRRICALFVLLREEKCSYSDMTTWKQNFTT